MGAGTLQLSPDLTTLKDCVRPFGMTLAKVSGTGSPFKGAHWRFFSRTFPPQLLLCQDVRPCFETTRRNDQGTLAEHMSADDCENCGVIPDRTNTVIFGRVVDQPKVFFPGFSGAMDRSGRPIDRSYERFMCADKGDDDAHKWFHGRAFRSDPPDGDIFFDVSISGLGLDNRDNNAIAVRYAKRQDGQAFVHVELIMYSRNANSDNCAGNVLLRWLPSWAESGPNSVLLNGRPLDGRNPSNVVITEVPSSGEQSKNCNHGNTSHDSTVGILGIFNSDKFACWVDSLGGKAIRPGAVVRITGVLAKDDHTGFDTPGIEIHPAYTIEVVDPIRTGVLTGAWEADDEGVYYFRQIPRPSGGNELWWLGLSSDRGLRFTNVFHGVYAGGVISGGWVDVPLGDARGAGQLRLLDRFFHGSGTSLERLPGSTGGFGARHWEQLYRRALVNAIHTSFPAVCSLSEALPDGRASLCCPSRIGNSDRVPFQPGRSFAYLSSSGLI
jgi:hypothetical protein